MHRWLAGSIALVAMGVVLGIGAASTRAPQDSDDVAAVLGAATLVVGGLGGILLLAKFAFREGPHD